ncbi:MAG: L-2-hydroxyglutarate oxidase [Bacteroidota bacterium]
MYSVVIIGGGIVGLASALRLKEANPRLKIAVLEKEPQLCAHQTGHNSGVIHSGLYYKPGSYKAKNCVDGYNQLIRFCEEEEVPYEICGKVVVATRKDQIPQLQTLGQRGQKNGLKGLIALKSKEQLQEFEPHVNGVAGLYVPQTGIIDYEEVARKYAEKFRHFGGEIFVNNEVKKVRKRSEKLMEVHTNHQTLITHFVIHCAGLWSDKVAKKSKMKVPYKIIPFRGEYYQLRPDRQHLVKNLIYPVPDPNFPFLGVHFTRMIKGGVEAGPNAVLAFKREGYKKSDIHLGQLAESLTYRGFQKVAAKYWQTGFGELYRSYSKRAFTKALQKLVPEIRKKDLVPGGAGVRAQACDRNGGLVDDFLILEDDKLLNVGNAPSPAATSSLAIGARVAEMAMERMA